MSAHLYGMYYLGSPYKMVLASDSIDLCLDLQSSIYYYKGWVFQDFVYFIGLVRNQTLKEPL